MTSFVVGTLSVCIEHRVVFANCGVKQKRSPKETLMQMLRIEAANERLVQNPTLGSGALDRLQNSTVAVVGAGALGWPLIQHAALLGIGLFIVDPGRVESEERARQATSLNPHCRVRTINVAVEDVGLGALADCDAVVTGLDSRVSRLHVSEICGKIGRPWVDAAVDGSGEHLFGTVTLYDRRSANNPCYACRFSTGGLDSVRSEARGPAEPTLQTSAFAGVIAGLQTLILIRLLLGAERDLSTHQQLLVDCDHHVIRSVQLRRNPTCPHHSQPMAPLRRLQRDTVGALVAGATGDLGAQPEQLLFHGRTMASRLTPCEASRLAHAPWAELGLPYRDVVTALAGDREAHYVVNETEQLGTFYAWRSGQLDYR
jgi:molybdopterin/thiamine biosynthesis adenylyltransferase